MINNTIITYACCNIYTDLVSNLHSVSNFKFLEVFMNLIRKQTIVRTGLLAAFFLTMSSSAFAATLGNPGTGISDSTINCVDPSTCPVDIKPTCVIIGGPDGAATVIRVRISPPDARITFPNFPYDSRYQHPSDYGDNDAVFEYLTGKWTPIDEARIGGLRSAIITPLNGKPIAVTCAKDFNP